MKVLFVLKKFPTLSETFIVNQIISLIDRGVDVKILSYHASKDSQAISDLVQKYTLIEKTFYLETNRIFITRIVDFLIFLIFNIHKINILHVKNFRKLYLFQWVLRDKYDVVHCHFGDQGSVFAKDFYQTGFFDHSKKICTFHGYDLKPAKIEDCKEEYQTLFSFFDAYTYNTPYLGKLLEDLDASLKKYQLTVGFNEVFLNQYKMPKKTNEKLKILFCGRLVNWKGCYELIDIAEKMLQIGEGDFILDIIGNGREAEKMKNQIQENPILKKHINLLGAKSQAEVFRAMNDSDVFLFPGKEDPETGRAETQGLVVQEAQFFNLPVIVSDAGGTKYGLLDGKSGFVVKSGDISSFVEKILFFKKDRKKITEFGQAGHDFVMQNYSSEKLGNLLLKIYKE